MVIVNLTTTSERLELCSATVWSLIHQSCLPDKIYLWISRDAYMADKGIFSIPSWVDEINSLYGILNIKYTDNTGPYRKIFPMLKEASDKDVLVYADDDVIYSSNWLELLLTSFYASEEKYAVASRIRLMNRNLFGYYQSYNRYPLANICNVYSNDFIITGVGGCVIKKKMINDKFINDISYLEVAPKTDDLWISKILRLSGTAVKSCPQALCCVQEIQHSSYSLNHENTSKFSGGIFLRLMYKFKLAVFGYVGISLSNNDKTQKNIDRYFKI